MFQTKKDDAPYGVDGYYEQVQLTNKLLEDILKRLPPPEQPSAFSIWFNKHRRVISIIPPLLAVTVWMVMLAYFLIYYVTLPRDAAGNLPRISDQYSTWPYISCIGANQLSVFRTCCIIVSLLLCTTFTTLCYLGRGIDVGSRFRRLTLLLVLISNVFLILLGFASINSGARLHLIFTSVQLITMAFGKGSDFLMNRLMRKWIIRRLGSKKLLPRPLRRAQISKMIIGFFAFFSGILLISGIYGCTDPVQIQTRGTKCFTLVSISGISEWILSLAWMCFNVTIAHDIWFLIDIREIYLQFQGYQAVQGSYNNNNQELERLNHPSYQFDSRSGDHSLEDDATLLNVPAVPQDI